MKEQLKVSFTKDEIRYYYALSIAKRGYQLGMNERSLEVRPSNSCPTLVTQGVNARLTKRAFWFFRYKTRDEAAYQRVNISSRMITEVKQC